MTLEDTAARIRLLVLDVDGVMTDGRIYLNGRGEETKAFDVRDGYGIKRVLDAGIEVAIITGRSSEAVERRARELGIAEVHQGVGSKEPLLDELLRRRNLEPAAVCCVGDDLDRKSTRLNSSHYS